jgi:hypothetical protein
MAGEGEAMNDDILDAAEPGGITAIYEAFETQERELRSLLLELMPIDKTAKAFLAGGPAIAQSIERLYERLAVLETNHRGLHAKVRSLEIDP